MWVTLKLYQSFRWKGYSKEVGSTCIQCVHGYVQKSPATTWILISHMYLALTNVQINMQYYYRSTSNTIYYVTHWIWWKFELLVLFLSSTSTLVLSKVHFWMLHWGYLVQVNRMACCATIYKCASKKLGILGASFL